MTALNEAIKNWLIIGMEMHGVCLVIIALLFANMCKSFRRSNSKKDPALICVYIGCFLMLLSDGVWSVVDSVNTFFILSVNINTLGYVINLVYFFGSSLAAACWFIFCTNQLETQFLKNKFLHAVSMLPYIAVLILYVLSPKFGLIFSINSGRYVRGSLFFFDPLIKIGYIGAASLLAVVSGMHKNVDYIRRKDFKLLLFGLPVMICGILQTAVGGDFNCLGVTFGLILMYMTGVTNRDSENTDAIYSLANSFEASYIVNMETGVIRALKRDTMHPEDAPGMESSDYSFHFKTVMSGILLPEDRINTLAWFEMENVDKRFEIDSSFSIRYRVKDTSGKTILRTATFIRASNGAKHEFLLGFNTIHSASLLYERNENLNRENKRLEQINTSIMESIAKIVEARDGGSGNHIIRVRKLTEVIAEGICEYYPEYKLDEQRVKLITTASVLHDVGKIVIPDAILLSNNQLSDEEFEIMKTHCTRGCDILNMLPLGLDDAFLEYAQSICRWHHERYDGKGYPDGLKGEDIPIAAQIVATADCFDALVSVRSYKDAIPPEKAIEMIASGECGAFSPKIISVMEKQRSKLIALAKLYS